MMWGDRGVERRAGGCRGVEKTKRNGGWRREDATSGEEVDATVYRQLVGSLMHLVNT